MRNPASPHEKRGPVVFSSYPLPTKGLDNHLYGLNGISLTLPPKNATPLPDAATATSEPARQSQRAKRRKQSGGYTGAS